MLKYLCKKLFSEVNVNVIIFVSKVSNEQLIPKGC